MYRLKSLLTFSLIFYLFTLPVLRVFGQNQTIISGVINTYTPVISFDSCNSITVQSASGFTPGDLVIIMQMKGASGDTSNTSSFGDLLALNNAGLYEYNRIAFMNANNILFQKVISHTYDVNGQVQLIRVPEYSTAIVAAPLTAQDWDGSSGGVLALRCSDTLILNDDINLDGKGFRGGTGSLPGGYVCNVLDYYVTIASTDGGQKGESLFNLTTTFEGGRGKNIAGGGGGNNHNSGGGGGANGGNGGNGGYEYIGCINYQLNGGLGGVALGYSNAVPRIFMGSGGGGGHQNNNVGSPGTDAGGLLMLQTNVLLSNNRKITANAFDVLTATNDGAGGGGAGGTLSLEVNTYAGNLTLECTGGDGGDNNFVDCHGTGAGGGGGMIWYSGTSLPANVTTNLIGGIAGVGNSNGCLNTSFGSADGDVGSTLNNLSLFESQVPFQPFTASFTITNPLCTGNNNASISAFPTGNPPYLYFWNTSPPQFTATALALTAGSYEVYILDNSGCFITDTLTVNDPLPIIVSYSTTVSSCDSPYTGSATLIATGGTGNLSYSWNTNPSQNTNIAINLSGGTYQYTVTDSNGCIASEPVFIYGPTAMTLSLNVQPLICNDASDAIISAVLTGGTQPIQYIWNTPSPVNNPVATGVPAGNYMLVVIDSFGCTDTAYANITNPPQSIFPSIGTILCDAFSLVASATGTDGPFTYSWNSTPPQNTSTASNLTPGMYTVTVTDQLGCTETDSMYVSGIIVLADAGPDMQFCTGAGGVQLSATATGGNGPYIYVWAPNNGSLSNPFAEDPVANPDSATTYYFYAIGADGCISNIDSVVVTPNDPPVVDVGADVWRCENGPGNFITATVLNPVGGYSVQWTPSIGLYCDTCLTTYATPDTTTVYCAVVTSLLTGCSSDPTTLNSLSCLTYTVRPRPVADAGPDFEICQYDSMSTCGIATSAGPQYSFAWSPNYGVNDSTLVCPNFSPPNTTWYTLVVTSNSCPSYADSVLVTVRPTLIGDAGQVRTICADDSVQLDGQYNGMATATGFMWSPAAGLSDSTAQTPMASPASTTWYYFTVFNGLCPSIPDSVQVIVNPRPIANAGPDLQLCPEGDSITISLATATAGLPPYTYLWQPSTGLQDATLLNPNLKPDTTILYTLTVFTGTAPNVCIDIDTMLVTVKPGLNLMVDIDTNTICQGQVAQLTSSAGSGSAVFTWSPTLGLSNPNAANTLANPDTTVTYYLTATEHGCTSIDSIRIRVLGTPDAAFTASSTEACGELSVAFLNLTADGSAYEWTFGDGSVSNQISPLHTYTQPGTYTVTLVALSPGGCADTLIMNSLVSLSDPGMADFRSTPEPPVEVSLPNSSTISFYDQSELAITWTWDFGDGVSSTDRNPNHTFVTPGVYYVTLTTKTADGCESTLRKGPYTVFTPELFIPNVFTPNNDGVQDGFLTNYGGDEAFLLQIFDRWGTKFFQTTNKNEAWQGTNLNGSKATDGVYFYTLRIGDRNYSGSVTMMR